MRRKRKIVKCFRDDDKKKSISEFEKQFPKPESLGDFDDVLLDCWKEKRKGWLAALKWALTQIRIEGICDEFTQKDIEQEIAANESR